MSLARTIRAVLSDYRNAHGSLALVGEFAVLLAFWFVSFIGSALFLAVGP